MATVPESDVGDGGRPAGLARRRVAVWAAVLAACVIGAGVAWAAGVFSSTSGSGGLTILPATVPQFPAPPVDAVVFAARAGTNALGLAIVPGKRRLAVQASVVASQEAAGVPGLDVRFRIVTGKRVVAVRGAACGAGCYRADVVSPWPKRIAVMIADHRPQSVSFTLPASADVKPGSHIVSRAEHVWLGLRSVIDRDSLSDGHATLETLWRIVAPDKLAYVVRGGGSSVIIGDRSWTKAAGGSVWTEQPQLPVKQPVPFWSKAVDANVLGSVSVAGRPAWRVSFFDPSTPGWYTILIDKATSHTVSVDMIATAHFMHDEYSGFNTPLSITPPRNVRG